MTREEAKTVFLNRGYVEVEGGTIYDADKWRGSCRVISEWLEQEPKTGHWVRWYEIIEEENCTIHDPHCKCSECDKEYDPYTSQFIKYCSNCGAKMIAESEVQDENNAGTR